jgi:class 3 adenylate cyclase/KaiC/GvpD/RAD55 family RecA-like ATPase
LQESERRLAAIMFTDIVGYTAMSQQNEKDALRLLEKHNEILRPIFVKHGGTEIKTIGDSFLVEFASALAATECAVEIQRTLAEVNKSGEAPPITVRIGIHLGDVVRKDNDIFGDAVNIASRIHPLADPGGICVSEEVYSAVRNKLAYQVEMVPAVNLKNVELPVNLFTIFPLLAAAEVTTSVEEGTFESEASRSDTQEVSVSTGVPALDKILPNGYPDRSAVLVVGPPGIGKEALGYWFTHFGLLQGDFCLYLTRLSVREVVHDTKGFGVNMQQLSPFWLAKDGGQMKYDLNDLVATSFSLKSLLNQNRSRRIRIVTDILSSLLMLYKPDVIYRFLTQLLEEIKRYDAVLVATLEEGMHKPEVLAAMEQLFDGVVELKLYEEGLRVFSLLRIRKMRGHPPQPSYQKFAFTKLGMEVSPYA